MQQIFQQLLWKWSPKAKYFCCPLVCGYIFLSFCGDYSKYQMMFRSMLWERKEGGRSKWWQTYVSSTCSAGIFCSWWICGFIGRWSLEDKVGLEYISFGYPKGSYMFNLRVHDRYYLSVENRIRLTKFWVQWKYYSVQTKDQTGFEVQETPHLWWWLGMALGTKTKSQTTVNLRYNEPCGTINICLYITVTTS